MLRHNRCFFIFRIFWKSDGRTNFSFSAILAQSFCHVLNKNNVVERKHVKEFNQLSFSIFYVFLCPSIIVSVTLSKKKKIVKSSLYHTSPQIKLSGLFFYPCLPITDGFNTVFFSFRFILGKINDFRVPTTNSYFAVSFDQCYFISVNFNRGTKYRLSVRHATWLL